MLGRARERAPTSSRFLTEDFVSIRGLSHSTRSTCACDFAKLVPLYKREAFNQREKVPKMSSVLKKKRKRRGKLRRKRRHRIRKNSHSK